MAATPTTLTSYQRLLQHAGKESGPLTFAVGSKNATKIASTEQALAKYIASEAKNGPEDTNSLCKVFGCGGINSGVDDQPKSAEDCLKGAINRARAARKSLNADFGVGIEGGVEKIVDRWFESGWVAVVGKDEGLVGVGTSARMEIGAPVMKHILEDSEELGTIANRLSGRNDVSTTNGYFGLCTDDQLTRTDAYVHGVLFALVPFVSEEKFWRCAKES